MRIGRRLRLFAFVTVVTADADGSGNKADGAEHTERCQRGLVRTQRLFGDDFAGKRVFGGGGDRVAGEAAVRLHSDQRALSLAVVVVDDECRAAVAVQVEIEVVARARGGEVRRGGAGRGVANLVVRAINGGDMRAFGAVQRVLREDVAVAVADFKGGLRGHGGSGVAFFCCQD